MRFKVLRRLNLHGGPGYVVIDTECPGEGGEAIPLGVFRDYDRGGREDAELVAEAMAEELNQETEASK